MVFAAAARRTEISDAKIGIGNISRANGISTDDHKSHADGLKVDIRPLRLDRRPLPVRWTDSAYDQAETRKLVNLIWQTGMATRILFNDPRIARVHRFIRHDDHLHVEVQP